MRPGAHFFIVIQKNESSCEQEPEADDPSKTISRLIGQGSGSIPVCQILLLQINSLRLMRMLKDSDKTEREGRIFQNKKRRPAWISAISRSGFP